MTDDSLELRYHEIASIDDDAFLPWLDAIQTGFPPDEQMLASYFIRLLRGKAARDSNAMSARLHAVLDGEGALAAATMVEMQADARVCYLWYLWVEPRRRSRGIGSEVYAWIVRTAAEAIPGLRAVVYEIERPDQAPNERRRIDAERRIAFYRRMGARVATNVTYHQDVGRPDQAPVLMYLVVHALAPMSSDEARELLLGSFDATVEPGQDLRLE